MKINCNFSGVALLLLFNTPNNKKLTTNKHPYTYQKQDNDQLR